MVRCWQYIFFEQTRELKSNFIYSHLALVFLALCLCLFFSLVYQIKNPDSKKENNTNEEQSLSDGRLNLKSEIGFKDISMSLSNKKRGDRFILQDIKGKASPGKMVCNELSCFNH